MTGIKVSSLLCFFKLYLSKGCAYKVWDYKCHPFKYFMKYCFFQFIGNWVSDCKIEYKLTWLNPNLWAHLIWYESNMLAFWWRNVWLLTVLLLCTLNVQTHDCFWFIVSVTLALALGLYLSCLPNILGTAKATKIYLLIKYCFMARLVRNVDYIY